MVEVSNHLVRLIYYDLYQLSPLEKDFSGYAYDVASVWIFCPYQIVSHPKSGVLLWCFKHLRKDYILSICTSY